MLFSQLVSVSFYPFLSSVSRSNRLSPHLAAQHTNPGHADSGMRRTFRDYQALSLLSSLHQSRLSVISKLDSTKRNQARAVSPVRGRPIPAKDARKKQSR